MKRIRRKISIIFLIGTIILLPAIRTEAFHTGLNYIPTSDMMPPDTLGIRIFGMGYINAKNPSTGKEYSFGDTMLETFTLKLGLPTLKLSHRWQFNMEVAMDMTMNQEEEIHGDLEDADFDAGVRILNEGVFGSLSPALAFGVTDVGVSSHTPWYVVATKSIPIPYFFSRVHAGYLWNNFGIDDESGFLLGLDTAIIPSRLYLMLDFYGKDKMDYGNYGVGLFWIIVKDSPLGKVYVSSSYFVPENKDKPYEDGESESIWFGLYFDHPLNIFK